MKALADELRERGDDELVQNYVLEDGSMEYHILLDSEGKKGFLQG